MDKTQPPIPSPEVMTDPVSVHMWYMRRDIGEIKITLSNLKDGYVSRTDFDEHLKTDADHEVRIRTIEKSVEDVPIIKKIVYGGVGLILTSFMTYLIYILFHR